MTDMEYDTEPVGGEDYSDAAATFGDRIVAAREARGYSVARLAEKIGVREETLEDWENDRSEPRANKMMILAGALNVSIVWLMTGDGEGLPRPLDGLEPVQVENLLVEVREIATLQNALTERLRRLERRLLGMKD